MGFKESILTRLWQKPKLITKDVEIRYETWLELFYDLIFVAVVAEIAARLSDHISLKDFFGFVFLYIPVWWVWVGSTIYNDRFEMDDVSHRMFTFFKMLPVGGMAITMKGALEEYSIGFAVSYILARLILIFLWYRAGSHNPIAKPLSDRYISGFAISITLWTISLFVGPEYRFYFWGAGLIFDLCTPFTTFKIQKKLPRLNSSHLNKRFGLFTILLLGESVIGILHGVTQYPSIDISRVIIAFFGLLLTFSIWWIYFDDVMQENRLPTFPWFSLWVYGHFFLAVGLTAFSAGISDLVKFENTDISWFHINWLLTGAFTLSLLALAIIEFSYVINQKNSKIERECGLLRLIGGGLILGVDLFVFSLGPILMLLILVLLQIFQIIKGRSVRKRLQLQ